MNFNIPFLVVLRKRVANLETFMGFGKYFAEWNVANKSHKYPEDFSYHGFVRSLFPENIFCYVNRGLVLYTEFQSTLALGKRQKMNPALFPVFPPFPVEIQPPTTCREFGMTNHALKHGLGIRRRGVPNRRIYQENIFCASPRFEAGTCDDNLDMSFHTLAKATDTSYNFFSELRYTKRFEVILHPILPQRRVVLLIYRIEGLLKCLPIC